MSSHREAPQISKDPVADSTDVYAFVSPDKPNTVTLIANYVPLQAPAGGPTFYEFGGDVLYEIHIDTTGDGVGDISYQFRFINRNTIPTSFLYNQGPLTINSAGRVNLDNWNRRQYYSVTRVVNGKATTLATNLACPPCNVGQLSTPGYEAVAADGGPEPFTKAFINTLPNGEVVFCGQRAEGFFVDLGAIFDLGQIRPLNGAHATFGVGGLMGSMPSVNSTSAVNVHSIAIQIPLGLIYGSTAVPTDPMAPNATIGVYTTASRQKVRTYETGEGGDTLSGAFTQVSRMGNPLFNEVLVPISRKDYWNASLPSADKNFAAGVLNPELAQLLPVLYTPPNGSTVFPNLAALNKKVAAGQAQRTDVAAALLLGIPAAVGLGFQNQIGTNPALADMLRLNVAVKPSQKNGTDTATNGSKGGFHNLGLAGGDAAGFPNGRRVVDDVTTIELKVLAGALYPLIDKTYQVDAAVGLVDQYLTNDGQSASNPNSGNNGKDVTAKGSVRYLTTFPYLGTPHSGYRVPLQTPDNELTDSAS